MATTWCSGSKTRSKTFCLARFIFPKEWARIEELRIGSLWMEGEMGVLSGEASWMDDKEKEKQDGRL